MIIDAIQIDPVLSKFVILSLTIILAGFLFRVLKQPALLTYIIVGLLLGPNGFKVITEESIVTNLGSLGLVLLLFFIGMEISLPRLITNWRISVIGTLLQVVVTILAIFIAGNYFGWELKRIVFWGFVLSLSSTAILVLSPALGAFVAGMLVSSSKSTEWVYQSLLSFKVLFVALFFVSIGMLIDLNFIRKNVCLCPVE